MRDRPPLAVRWVSWCRSATATWNSCGRIAVSGSPTPRSDAGSRPVRQRWSGGSDIVFAGATARGGSAKPRFGGRSTGPTYIGLPAAAGRRSTARSTHRQARHASTSHPARRAVPGRLNLPPGSLSAARAKGCNTACHSPCCNQGWPQTGRPHPPRGGDGPST
jgi:hypothetical protein